MGSLENKQVKKSTHLQTRLWLAGKKKLPAELSAATPRRVGKNERSNSLSMGLLEHKQVKMSTQKNSPEACRNRTKISAPNGEKEGKRFIVWTKIVYGFTADSRVKKAPAELMGGNPSAGEIS